MCAQHIGGCSVHLGVIRALEESISTLGDTVSTSSGVIHHNFTTPKAGPKVLN